MTMAEMAAIEPQILMSSDELRAFIKRRAGHYLSWMRHEKGCHVPDNMSVLCQGRDFMFTTNFTHLNFHPDILSQVQDLLKRKVERVIAIHDYIGHVASSQALCWNVVLPMKKHENYKPLFDTLNDALERENIGTGWNFGVDTSVLLELNVSEDLGECGKAATSIDLYLRTPHGKVCAVEFKLSEPDFGRCKLPGTGRCDGKYGSPEFVKKNRDYTCYLALKGRKYWQLGCQYGLLDPTKVNVPCPLNEYYQALRNLMAAKTRSGENSSQDVRGIFVLAADFRNSAFWGPDNHFDCFKQYSNKARGRKIPDVFRISIQDIVSRFEGKLGEYREYFNIKYGF
jgi:hypothetical protein